MKNPLKFGAPGWACAEAVKQSTYGPGRDARIKTMQAMSTDQAALDKANAETLAAIKGNADTGTQMRLIDEQEAAQKKYDATYADYRALPGEADAWAVGDKLGAGMQPPAGPK